MATYKLIIQNIINVKNNIFLFNTNTNNINQTESVDGVVEVFFSIFLNKHINARNKFMFFKETLESCLIKNKESQFIEYFCKIQKIYNVLNRFVYNFKYKRAKIVVNTDMYLNQLDINNENVFCLFHNNSKYFF